MSRRLVLASSSPRRHALLAMAGYDYAVIVPDVDETRIPGEDPAAMVERLALLKAGAVAASEETAVVAVDTTVVLDGEVIGKPRDENDAVAILLKLSGRTHLVLSGWAVSVGSTAEVGVAPTAVTMRSIDPSEATAYVATGEPMDKAGAYALQGEGVRLVADLEGSRSNVMGLPLEAIVPALHRAGVERSGAVERRADPDEPEE
jgi:septum formation protein